jgi:hypothetical protein
MSEFCFSATKKAQGISLEILQKELHSAGLSCTVELESADHYWVVFERFEATIYASTRKGKVVFATLHQGRDEEPDMVETIASLMKNLGFLVDKEGDYA